MTKIQNLPGGGQGSKQYDLEERTFNFARQVRRFASRVNKSSLVIDDIRQVIRSSGSIAANYIEANEALSRKDFIHRIKICRKEAKETRLWLRLLHPSSQTIEKERKKLIEEATELMKIFGAIVEKCKG